ncbi:hypothetical protein PTKIN_Ptkin03bG0011400 [Pterospermum kingtungense]
MGLNDVGLDNEEAGWDREEETFHLKPNLGGWVRRPNVIISDKEVIGQGSKDGASGNYPATRKEIVKLHEGLMGNTKSRHATVKTKHTVVRGADKGKFVVRTVVHHISAMDAIENTSILQCASTSEHH